MAIVIDNDPKKSNLFIVENDLNLLRQIKIPTIFMDQKTGLNLLSVVKNSSEDFIISIDFQLRKSIDVT